MSELKKMAMSNIVLGILIIIFASFVLFFGEDKEARFLFTGFILFSGLVVGIGGLIFLPKD